MINSAQRLIMLLLLCFRMMFGPSPVCLLRPAVAPAVTYHRWPGSVAALSPHSLPPVSPPAHLLPCTLQPPVRPHPAPAAATRPCTQTQGSRSASPACQIMVRPWDLWRAALAHIWGPWMAAKYSSNWSWMTCWRSSRVRWVLEPWLTWLTASQGPARNCRSWTCLHLSPYVSWARRVDTRLGSQHVTRLCLVPLCGRQWGWRPALSQLPSTQLMTGHSWIA